MPKLTNDDIKPFISFLDSYDKCWIDRDIDAFKKLYVSDGVIPFFGNHSDCDSDELSDHIEKVSNFFNSKDEKIVELLRESIKYSDLVRALVLF